MHNTPQPSEVIVADLTIDRRTVRVLTGHDDGTPYLRLEAGRGIHLEGTEPGCYSVLATDDEADAEPIDALDSSVAADAITRAREAFFRTLVADLDLRSGDFPPDALARFEEATAQAAATFITDNATVDWSEGDEVTFERLDAARAAIVEAAR